MAGFNASTSVTIDAPTEEVFAYVTNYRNVPGYMEGVVSWEPVGEDHGVGTIYRQVFQAGPRKFTAEVEVTEVIDSRLMHWEPRSGLRNAGTWHFERYGDRTKVTFEQEITPPGGMTGRLLAQTLDPIIRTQYRRSLDTLKKQIEALPAHGRV